MKVIRNSARNAHRQAKSVHKTVMQHHKSHADHVAETNSEIRAVHAQQKESHKELMAAYEDECKRIDEKHAEHVKAHEEYEQARIERDKKIAEVKSKLPKPLPFPPPQWVCELLNWPRFPLPEKPAPEHPGYFTKPSEPEEPVLVETHHEPEFHMPEPAPYDARRIEGDDYEEVQTEWGVAIAVPGSWVLKDEENNFHIVPDEVFNAEYSKA